LKATDLQAAVGCAQLEKLDEFTKKRKDNFLCLWKWLQPYKNKLILPQTAENADPSWFGFPLTVREDAGFTRDALVLYLERHQIQTRSLFAGNLIKHPCFDEFRNDRTVYRQIGNLENTNRVMTDTFWIGVYPGMTERKLRYMADTIGRFIMGKHEGASR